MAAHTASSSLGVRIYMASSSSVCAEWGHREHQWATATALSKCKVCAARTALPSQPQARRPRRACDSGTICIRAPSEPLRAVAQPLPGLVPSARLCASLRLRASAIGIRQLRSSFVAVAPHTHASARWFRQRRCIRSALIFVCHQRGYRRLAGSDPKARSALRSRKRGEWLYRDVRIFAVRFPVHVPAGPILEIYMQTLMPAHDVGHTSAESSTKISPKYTQRWLLHGRLYGPRPPCRIDCPTIVHTIRATGIAVLPN